MPLHLGPEPQHKASAGECLQVVGRIGNHHRAARKRNRDPGPELDALARFGREHQGKKGLVLVLGGHQRVEALALGAQRRVACVPQRALGEAGYDPHDVPRPLAVVVAQEVRLA